MTVTSYAKVNWTLDVFERRPDGYHEIASIMQRIKLCDLLTFSHNDSGIQLSITGTQAEGVPSDSRNIVYRAAQILGIDQIQISIEKNIPNQAGLGGGSSNAAATLLALNDIFSLGHTFSSLLEIAPKLGADVGYFLCPGTARVEGLGERVTPIVYDETVDLVLLKPETGVSTAAAYDTLDQTPNRISYNTTGKWPHGGPSNDFEDVVYTLNPDVAAARAALKTAGAEQTLLCGSGATVMGWGGNLPDVANNLRKAGFRNIWLTQTF